MRTLQRPLGYKSETPMYHRQKNPVDVCAHLSPHTEWSTRYREIGILSSMTWIQESFLPFTKFENLENLFN